MRFAVIAAGEGSRLAQEGVKISKPLVEIDGKPMIDRLIEIFCDNGASEVCVIVNARMEDLVVHMLQKQVENAQSDCPVHVKVMSTPSSLHSLVELSPWLEGEPFCLTTVDTIFHQQDFGDYIQKFQENPEQGLMAVTAFVDDEKPLYVDIKEDDTISGFYDERHGCRFVSGGIYCLPARALDVARKCVAEGRSRMRNFQRRLVEEGIPLKAYAFSKILDIDHREDIQKAHEFLRRKYLLGVLRDKRFSPNSDDSSIMHLVRQKLTDSGFSCRLVTETSLWGKMEIDGVFHMARSAEALNILKEMEDKGVHVVNCSQGISVISDRQLLADIMTRQGISVPLTMTFSLGDALFIPPSFPGWLKRKRGTTEYEDDVSYVLDNLSYNEICSRFAVRGISDLVWTEHLEGDLIKFYGVAVTDFFFWYYPAHSKVSSKFGLEQNNSSVMKYPFEADKLHEQMDHLALSLGIPVYGGDCIVNKDGLVSVIDFNDWPSFSPCREEASDAIVELMKKIIE